MVFNFIIKIFQVNVDEQRLASMYLLQIYWICSWKGLPIQSSEYPIQTDWYLVSIW